MYVCVSVLFVRVFIFSCNVYNMHSSGCSAKVRLVERGSKMGDDNK